MEPGKLAQVARELQTHDYQNVRKLAQAARENLHANNIQKEGTDFPDILACVPWGHHIEIIAKCKNIDESIFYILKTISGGWSRNTLINCIKADYYHTSRRSHIKLRRQTPVPAERTCTSYHQRHLRLRLPHPRRRIQRRSPRNRTRKNTSPAFSLNSGQVSHTSADRNSSSSQEDPANWICSSTISTCAAT